MKIYDYFKTAEDMKNGKIYATFTEEHDAERLHFESLSICTCCRVSEWPAVSEPQPAAPAADPQAEKVADLLAAGEPVKARADLAGYLYEIGPHVLNETQAEAVLFILEDRETLALHALELGGQSDEFEKRARESREALERFAAADTAARHKFESREAHAIANEAVSEFATLTDEADDDRAAYLLARDAEHVAADDETPAAVVIRRAAHALAETIKTDETHARELLADIFTVWRENLIHDPADETPDTIESESEPQAEAVAAPAAGTIARAARVFLLALTLTAAPAAADTTDEPQAADVAELLTADPLAEVIRLQAAGLTVSHVTIKSTTPAAC